MSEPQFVYGTYRTAAQVSRTVKALVRSHIEPDEIDVVAVRGDRREQVQLVHRQPVLSGLLLGALVGLVGGIVTGKSMAPTEAAEVSAFVVRWALTLTVTGSVFGILMGLAWWRTSVDLRRHRRGVDRYVVGTAVSDTRSSELEALLKQGAPDTVSHRPIGTRELVERRARRNVKPRVY